METKICKTCGIEKPISEFHKSSVGAKGVIAHCKECHNWNHRSEESKQIYLEQQEFKERGVKRCACCGEIKNVSEFSFKKTGIYGRHSYCKICLREKSLETSRKPSTIQKKKEREATREFLDNLAEYRRQSSKYKERVEKYKKEGRYKEYQSEYNKKLQVRLRNKISLKIYVALKTQNESKMLEFDDYLGCTIEFFKEYISSLFQDGMSWDNWGRGSDKWHIDHIKPCASFDFSDINQQKECFHYSNQQPLWEHDNLSKSSKIGDKKYYHNKCNK